MRALGADFIKYNYSLRDFDSEPGYTRKDYEEQTDTLLRFAELLPANVKLLCECHANTLMEKPEIAGEVFKHLDERFGAIIHLSPERALAEGCFRCYGERICHIHTAYRSKEKRFELLESADALLRVNMQYFKKCRFYGSATVEFTKEDRLFDATEEYSYYEAGIIKRPIVATNHIKKFTESGMTKLWAYYCMAQRKNVANRFIAQPSYRNRILGLQLYKYNIEGFLQWGFNFWLSAGAQKVIDPYKNTTADMSFPGGDPFVVYPLDKFSEVVCSLRLYVFNEALQDMRALYFLEQHLGRDNVLKLLSDIDGFEVYPKNEEYILNLRSLINRKAEEIING